MFIDSILVSTEIFFLLLFLTEIISIGYKLVCLLFILVMGIGNIFKIDDRYINIDRWSIIGGNCLLNVFTNSLYFKRMIDKSKDMIMNKIVS